jgi:hypothetical protein
MKPLFTAIAFTALLLSMNARAAQPDLIESGALREDGKRFTEYHRSPRLDSREIEGFRSAFLKYVTERMKAEDGGEASAMLKREWKFAGEMPSGPSQPGAAKVKVLGLIYKAESVTILVYNDTVFAQWVVENPSMTTRRKMVLIAGWNGEDVKQIVIEE